MASDQPKAVLAAMREWQAVTDDLANIARAFDTTRLDAPSACGDWTNRQLLMHLATGYGVRIAALQSVVELTPALAIDADEANAGNVLRLEGAGVDAIVAEMTHVRGHVLALLSRLTANHLSAATVLGGGGALSEALSELNAHDLGHVAELRG